MSVAQQSSAGADQRALTALDAARAPVDEVLRELDSREGGLTGAEAAARLIRYGPNAVRTHRVAWWQVLGRQLRSALLALLAGTAAVAALLGSTTEAAIIALILLASIGLGFANEYRAARAAEALHERMRHTSPVLRDGALAQVDVTALVPGDVVRLSMGQVVPADLRLLAVDNLECDESLVTGESMPVTKQVAAVRESQLVAVRSCALMGTVVHAGSGTGVVVATAARTEFGRIALDLGDAQPETAFQLGLRHFSGLLLRVAGVLTVMILIANLALHRPLIEAVLFSLAIAVGMTPQLLPAVVSTSLAMGARQLEQLRVLVKRLVCIEDLGDIEVLLTDKTGTLTDGRISFVAALGADGDEHSGEVALRRGRLCVTTDEGAAAAGTVDALDAALCAAAAPAPDAVRLADLPFDHERRMTSVLIEQAGEVRLVTKGAPETVLTRCVELPPDARTTVEQRFRAGDRLVAVASRPAERTTALREDDERDLRLDGFLVFLDQPKATASTALHRLADLGLTVKVVTGDNPLVAQSVCEQVGLPSPVAVTGADLDALDDAALASTVREANVFARVTPEQKARIVRSLREQGQAVGFLGDGVNDALALHAADVGISVDSGTDVAQDAADIILLEKDLDVLADGIAGGRRIFANTMKYVLMGTSSNFGNMFSAAAASAVLPFLPMLPAQILLNNLLYDTGQLSIPTDRVDAEQLLRPAHWDMTQIRRFMLLFGPLSSLFDFATFAVLLGLFQAAPPLFRTGWFIESMATQVLVVFVIRTRRNPFWRSTPSRSLAGACVAVVAAAVLLPYLPFSDLVGLVAPPPTLLAVMAAMVVGYLLLVDAAKRLLEAEVERPTVVPRRGRPHRIHRRAGRFSHGARLTAH
ncbi:magnesium-translocating P-type ATPase [Angustibacter sp. Root456]|uniref:magnesium-translocating P-type ATPase n=1 Tax=Angustibacter sp. Root456 TaxID=1736539 RepID=UPI0006FBC122|nr:magnesium-translocating P-type ATPase [Angustibacter sp. Root456]KQX61624.1 magnesium-transporting ATPase [Angustibacter sp. Root456]